MIKALCEPVKPPQDTAAYLHYFCAADTSDKEALKENQPKRVALYKLTVGLIVPMPTLPTSWPRPVICRRRPSRSSEKVDHYEKVRSEVKLASGDYIDLKVYEPAMRHLLDT